MAVPLQALCDPEGSRKLRFPYFMTTSQDSGKVVSLTHRPPLPPGNAPGTHFCQRLSRPEGHSAIGRRRYNISTFFRQSLFFRAVIGSKRNSYVSVFE